LKKLQPSQGQAARKLQEAAAAAAAAQDMDEQPVSHGFEAIYCNTALPLSPLSSVSLSI
jgi:hypothetical protein